MGDFNEVCDISERFGSIFNKHGAEAFNSFIVNAGLVEVPLGGCSFTWFHKSAKKMSKLDCFLIFDNLMCSFPSISSTSLDRFLSDHRPIIMWEAHYDYMPIPFKFFHYWFELDGFDKLVEQTWLEANARLHKESLNSRKSILNAELADLDVVIDKGEGSDANGHRRREVVRLIQEVEKVDAMEVAQKAKIKWSIEGDENSKYYHGVLNKKRGRLTIRGILVDGIWMESPHLVPNANMVKDFRPISLIESLYKIIVKVIANRLVTVLDDIIDEIQSAFVTDRQILDGPFILNEIVHWCKNKKKQSMIFKFDFEKAYDLVRWDFIDDILRRINMNKRNLMGISVDSNKVKHAAAKIGALKYGIYSCAFFNCADVSFKKPSWVRWKSVLAAKDVGGLGVSSLFALNWALIFKWVWRFFSQKNSLWVRVVKALHGENGKIDKKVQPRYPSTWLNIINESKSLKLHGIDLAQFERLKEMVEGVTLSNSNEMVEGVTLSNSNDRWSWSLVGSGDFSVSSVRKLIDNAILSKGISKTRWIKEAPDETETCLSKAYAI
nr:RNA-directed DNA polymerase, eukaryota [Tanacetum cinerariifolium]